MGILVMLRQCLSVRDPLIASMCFSMQVTPFFCNAGAVQSLMMSAGMAELSLCSTSFQEQI